MKQRRMMILNSKISKIRTFFHQLHLKKRLSDFYNDFISFPLHLIAYPIQGFDEFKRESRSKNSVAWFYLLMMILTQIIAYHADGFLVNKNNPNDFSLLLTISLIVFPVFIGVVGNWSITALMDGKGSMSEIFRVITYSFFPYVVFRLLSTLLSNYMTTDELIFYHFLKIIGIVLMVYLMFFGLMNIHEYGLAKTILMFIFTIVAIAVILFILLLFLSLLQQMYSFIDNIYQEFKMRFLLCLL